MKMGIPKVKGYWENSHFLRISYSVGKEKEKNTMNRTQPLEYMLEPYVSVNM